MKFLLSLLLFVFLSFESFSQKKETQPFGVRYYGYMPGKSSKNMSFSARKAAGKGARKWAYIDVQYKNALFYDVGDQFNYQETNVLFTGADVRVNIPKGRHLAYFGYSRYLPITYSTLSHPFYYDAREGTEHLWALSYGYSYVFNVGTNIKREIMFLKLGTEIITRQLSFTKDHADHPDEQVSPKYSYNNYNIGLGYHFSGPWFCEVNYSKADNSPSVIGFGLGYRIAIKR